MIKPSISARNSALLVAACLIAAGPAQAAAVSDAGAADVKKEVEDALAFPLNLGKLTGGGLSQIAGGIEVKPNGDHYDVKVTGLAFTQPQMGLKADIGAVTGTVTPGDHGEYALTITAPDSIKVSDDREPVADLSAGSQHFSAVWWPKYHAFTQIDASYTKLHLRSLKKNGPVDAEIDSFKDTLALTNDGDVWSGPSKVEVSGIKLNAGIKGQVALTIDGASGDAVYDKMNLAIYKDIETKSAQLLASAASGKPQGGEKTQAMLSSMVSGLQAYIDGLNTHFKLSNLKLNVVPEAPDPASGQKAEGPFTLSLATLTTASTMSGLMEDKGNISLAVAGTGFETSGVPPALAGAIPGDISFEIHADNLPLQSVGKQFTGLLSQALSGPMAAEGGDPTQKTAMQQQFQTQLMLAMAALPAELTAAGTKLTVTNTYTKAPEIVSNVEGSFVANTASPLMAEGSLTLVITGLHELLDKFQTMMSGGNADPHVAGWYQNLGMVEMMGKHSKAADGRSQTTYKVELTPDGRALLNGQDAMNAIGGAAGGGGAPGGHAAPQQAPTGTP
jgi:hypothetical protein